MEPQRYQVIQDDQQFILSTNIINNKIRIECQDNNYQPSIRYSRDYSLSDLTSFSEIFTLAHSLGEAQNELNNAIERQQVNITNQGEIMEINFKLQIDSYAQEVTFQLPPKQRQTTHFIQSNSNEKESPISPQIMINNPIYKESNLPAIGPIQKGEEEYPDVTYSTQPDNPKNNANSGLLDHERINKIENNEIMLKNAHENLRKRLNDLKIKIQFIKKETNDIRGENGNLNIKTLELKKQFNNLIEAEAALRTENDDLRRENHELILKKNELGFYTMEHHNNGTIREVNIPNDGKSRRPTNVSKTEKQTGGGYTSYNEKSRDIGYSSSSNNNNNY